MKPVVEYGSLDDIENALSRTSECEIAHLDKRVDHTNVGTGVEDLAEPRLSVDQLQLVELLVVL